MPNGIKYNLSAETLALKKGNFYIATGDVGKGPTSTSGFYNGITPPSSGYTIYLNKASNGPSIYVPSNDSQLISLTNGIAGTSFTSATQCLNYYATQTDKMVFNRDYEGIITNGLVLNLDAGFTPSYSTSGVTWYDLSNSGNNGTLTNGPTYSTDGGGTIVFDGADDYVGWGNNPLSGLTSSITYDIWVKFIGAAQNAFTLSCFNFRVYHQNNSVWYISGTGTGDRNISWTYTTNWVNFVYSFDGTNHICYINGTTYTVNSGGGLSSQSNLQISGRNSGSLPLNGNIAITKVYNRGLTSTEILQNYNAQKTRFIPFDTDAQAFITAAGITDSTQQNAVNQLVLDLKSYSLWTKMSAIYPFVGGTSTTHKFNLKDPRDLDVAYRLAFFGGWTHNANGITGNGTNTYADTFSFSYRTIGVYSRVNGKFLGQSAASEDNEGFMSNYVGFEMVGNSLLANNNSINISGSPFTKMYTVVDSNNSNANSLKVYRNGIDTLTTSSAGATPWSKSINYVLGATRYAEYGYDMYPVPITVFESGFGVANIALACFSDSMFTALEAANLNNLVVTFQTTLSRNV